MIQILLLAMASTGVLSQSCDIRSHPCWAETTEQFRTAFNADGFDKETLCSSDELYPIVQCVRDYRRFEEEMGVEGEGDCVDHDLAAEVLEVLMESCRSECRSMAEHAAICDEATEHANDDSVCIRLTHKTECLRQAQPQCQLMDAVDDVIAYTKASESSVSEDLALMGVGFSAEELSNMALCLRRELALEKRFQVAQQAAARQAVEGGNYPVNRRNMWSVFGGRAKRTTGTCSVSIETASTACAGPVLEAMGLSLNTMYNIDPIGDRNTYCSNVGNDFSSLVNTAISCYATELSGDDCENLRDASAVLYTFLKNYCASSCDSVYSEASLVNACFSTVNLLTNSQVSDANGNEDSATCTIAQAAAECAMTAVDSCSALNNVIANMDNYALAGMNPIYMGASPLTTPDHLEVLYDDYCDTDLGDGAAGVKSLGVVITMLVGCVVAALM